MKIKQYKGFQFFAYIILIVAAVSSVLPFMLMLASSFTDEKAITQNGYSLFPTKFSFAAYTYLGTQSTQLIRAYGITIFITFVGTLVSLIITSMIAYPLSRKDLPFRKIATFLVVITLLFNGGLVPTYLLYTEYFHIKNTIWALIVPGLLMNGFNVMLVKTFFQTSIPAAIIESAQIDGAGEFKIFFKIILPLSLPIMATVGLMVGIGYWNDWYNGMIYLTNPKLFSIQNILNNIMSNIQFLSNNSGLGSHSSQVTENLPSTTVRMAIAVIGIIPIMVLYPFFQKYFVKGITLGAVKG